MRHVVLIALIGLASVTAEAQTDRENISVDSMVEKLAPAPKTRSLTRNLIPTAAKLDLTIHFDFNSEKLQARSKPLLDNLATAMQNDRLNQLKFRVEGHTDAKGTALYNEALSMRRASTVVAYLSSKGIEPVRLQAQGKGFRELIDPSNPNADTNRRVTIVSLSE
jgi:outer membrane protein OmpA-like peptidoglycan-associated protein